MIHGQNDKGVVVLKPQSLATTATATGNIDTIGHDVCDIDITLDSAASTTNNPAVLKLSSSDDTVVTNFADITEFVGDGAGGFTIPNADAANPQLVRMSVNLLKNRKRFLKLALTPAGATQLVGASARLSRAENSPRTAALAGLAAHVIG